MKEGQLTGIQKMILLCSMAQLSIEYIDDLLQDPEYNFWFVREVKRDSKNLQRTLEGLLTRITHDQPIDVKSQFVDNYIALSELLEAAILAAAKAEREEYEGQDS